MSEPIKNRYEFVYLFDVENGNPNGDPDAGNMPRVDPETNHGLITDVCLKRKIRNYVDLVKDPKRYAKLKDGPEQQYNILIREKAILNDLIQDAYKKDETIEAAYRAWLEWSKEKKKKQRPEKHPEDLAKEWMCKNYFDVRTFGAVMSTGDAAKSDKKKTNASNEEKEDDSNKSKLRRTAGQVRGPVQINFARSIEPIFPLEVSITRMAVTNERHAEKERAFGRKHIVPYALYRAEGYISAKLAEQTGFSDEDLKWLLDALVNMFDHDRSAARGKMTARGLFVFKHDSALGNAPAHKLFDLVSVERKKGEDGLRPARSFSDYEVRVDRESAPAGVTLDEVL